MAKNIVANLLIIEDPQHADTALSRNIQVNSIQLAFSQAKNVKDAIKVVLDKSIQAIIIDFDCMERDALEFLDMLALLNVGMIPTIVVMHEKNEDIMMKAFTKGVKDCLYKDKEGKYLEQLTEVLEKELIGNSRFQNKNQKENFKTELESVSDGIIGINLKGEISFCSPSISLYLHKPFETLIGSEIIDSLKSINKNFITTYEEALKQVQHTERVAVLGQHEITLNEKDTKRMEISLSPTYNEKSHLEGYVLSFRDVSGSNNKLNDQNNTIDKLTGLLNRNGLIKRLEDCLIYSARHKNKCAVLFIDLDNFKELNDVLGRESGDELLKQVLARIKSVIRGADVLARIGSDEFVVLLTHINESTDAGKVAVKINQALIPSFDLHGQRYYTSASIGISVFPHDSMQAEKLLQYADIAMSMVKKQGKNHYQYYKSELNVEAERIIKISYDLRQAILKDQLDLNFHPQVDAKTGDLMGLEVLVRWKHPELGMIPPSVFIPIAEKMGFISSIGKWVLNRACQCYILWKQKGLENFKLSINLSINELQRAEIVEDIANCIYHYPIDPSRFLFEITESIFANDPKSIILKLNQLKQMNLNIAMDDFGTGYSCLSYLNNLPIDILKIDRAFVQGLSQHNDNHRAIISMIIELAKRLDMVTLAEGVETEEQAEILRDLGCDQLQGFLFARPMSFEQATDYIKKQLPKSQARGA